MRKALFAVVVALAVSSTSAVVSALPITVHNTGVDGSDSLVAGGAQTSFWTLSVKPGGAPESIGDTPFRYFNGAYFADAPVAAWVSPQAGGSAGPLGIYTYDLVIDLTGLDPNTASISGFFGTDNSGAIYLNGNAPVATTTSGEFGNPKAFTINSGFVPGLNTIHLDVNNETDPTAFFVLFDSASAAAIVIDTVEVPTMGWPALAVLALALAGLGVRFARRA